MTLSKPFRIIDSLWRRALDRRAYWDKYRLCLEGLPINAEVEARRQVNRRADKQRREKEKADRAADRREAHEKLTVLQLELAPDVQPVALCVRCRGPFFNTSGGFLKHPRGAGCKMNILKTQRIVHVLRCTACASPRRPAVVDGLCALHAGKRRAAVGGR